MNDVQWYMYHQRNVVFYAAFSADRWDADRALAMARGLVAAAPQFNAYYTGAGHTPSRELLARIVSVETVESFDGFPDCWLDDGARVFEDEGLPLFRIRVARRETPDAKGRRSFVLVQAAHLLAEGWDSARLTRSRPAEHVPTHAQQPDPWWVIAGARTLAWLAAPLQVLAAHIFNPHPEHVVVATRAYPRAQLAAAAHSIGVRQRALFLALVCFAVCGGGTAEGRRRIHVTSSSISDGPGSHRDRFLRMHLIFESFRNRPDLAEFTRAIDRHLRHEESAATAFGSELHAATTHVHRRLAGRLPSLYTPAVFAFMPSDLMFALLPPHRLAGPLTEGLAEPLYSGASMQGISGCVVAPGREWVTFNFYLEEHLLPRLARLDALMDHLPLTPRSS